MGITKRMSGLTCLVDGCISPEYKGARCKAHHSEFAAAQSAAKRNNVPFGDCYVYAILAEEFDPPRVKFGYSQRPENRLMDLQVGSPTDLKLAGKVKGSKRLEESIHSFAMLENKRGEWFEYTGSALTVTDFIIQGDEDGLRARVMPAPDSYRRLKKNC